MVTHCLHIMDNNNKPTLATLSGRAYENVPLPSPLGNPVAPTSPLPQYQIEPNAGLLKGIFDASAQAIVVVDRECRLEAINTAAHSAIAYNSQIRVSVKGKLKLQDGAMHAAMLEHVTKVTSGQIDKFTVLLSESSDSTGAFARISPLQCTCNGTNQVLAIICFSDVPPALYDHRLAYSLYKLSRAELAVCEELVSGNSVKQISASRGTSTETVRYQLKSIFAKTQTNSQHGLVSLLLRTTALPSFR